MSKSRFTALSQLPWQVGSAPRQLFGPCPADDMASVSEWLTARVPGDVRADLVAARRLAALETPQGIAASEWVDDYDWWYRVRVPGALSPDEILILEAEGIDYYSAIWLDDRLLATHAGMFSRQTVLLSPRINDPGPHELRVRVWGGGALSGTPAAPIVRGIRALISRLSPGTEYFPQRMTVPKAQFSYGWDFSPRVLSCGIWDDIRLVSCQGAYIQDMWVSAVPLEERDPTPARWRVRLTLHRFGAQPLSATVTVSDPDGVPLFGFTHTHLDGRAPEICFDMPGLYRWWPWDQGQPHLYRVTVQVFDRQGWADERSITTGMRTITRDTLADGKPWRFTVNNRHVFLRGANWVPVDILPGRAAPADYRAWLSMARAAGINFLRVWGGGIREKQAFWDECDKQGILAWQEFPLACAFLDHYPRDASYLDMLQQEARGTVRLLRNHPSLLAWCGGNEINPKREAAPLATLQSVVAEEDPERPWIPVSPLIRAGDVHEWGVWHGGTPWPALAERTDAFLSEFGLQALPNAITLSEMFDCKPPELWRRQWEARKAQTSKLRHYGGPAMDTCLDAAISESQRVQSAAMQAGLEACRIRREPAAITRSMQPVPCGGVAFWQLNDPWPVVSWSVIDYWRRPKLAYEMLRYAYQPVLIATRFARRAYRAAQVLAAEAWLVNDGPETHTGCTAEARLDEVLIWRQDSITVYSGRAATIGGFEVTLARRPGFLTLELTCGVDVLARNRYDLQVPVTSRPGLLPRLRRRLADRLLTG